MAANGKREVSMLFAWFICGLGALFYCYEYLLRILPSIMAPDLMRTYHMDAASFGNLAAFYYYAYTPMQLPVGILMDHYGPRRLLIFASSLCAIGTYLFASADIQSIWMAMLGRFLVGFGSAFAFVGVLKLATIWLPPYRFGLIVGLTTTLGMVGAMVGDISLAVLVKAEGWRNTALYLAIVGVLVAVTIGLIMPDSKHPEEADSTLKDIKLLFVDLLKLLENPYIWLNGIVGCLLYLSLSAFAELWGVPYLETAHHYSRTNSANLISLVFLGWALGGPFIGWLSDKMQKRRLPIIWGAILTAIIFMVIIYVPSIPRSVLALLLFLVGVSSSAEVIVFATARELSSPRLSATALAFTNMLVMLAGIISQPAIGILLEKKWSGHIVDGVHIYSALDYQFALTAIPLVTIIAAVIMFFMKESYPKNSNGTQ